MAVRLIFPDETELAGVDATDVLRRLGNIQWTPTDVAETKVALSDRAWAWNNSLLDPLLPDSEFLMALDDTGMVAVDWTATKAPGKPKPGT